jgi:hypothetical protein
MLEVSKGVQCTPCPMIERGNFEPLSPKKNLILKILILKTLKVLILTPNFPSFYVAGGEADLFKKKVFKKHHNGKFGLKICRLLSDMNNILILPKKRKKHFYHKLYFLIFGIICL